MSPAIDSPFHSKFFPFVLHNSSSHFQALQKICIVSHLRSMVDILHANAIQQLEVALLYSPAAQVIDLLSGGWVQTKPVPTTTSIWPCPQVYTSTLPATALTSVPVLGVSSLISTESMPSDESLTTGMESQDVPMSTPKHCHITPTPVWSSDSPMPFTSSTSSDLSTTSASYPVVVVPELAIPAEANPECLN